MSKNKNGFVAKLIAACRFIKNKLAAVWHWYKSCFIGQPWYKKLIATVLSFLAFVIFYIFAVSVNLFWLFGRSPSIHSIMNPKTAAASEVYSADGVLIGKYFNENRQPVPYDSISPMFFKTLISTEDERFYQHHGIDYRGIFAALKDATHGHARGASTITQQLVKNMFRVRTEYSTGLLGYIPGVKILVMKSKEMILATALEMFYDKKEILTMYANTVDFGSNAYGIKTAARTYFNTTPKELKVEQSAVLVGLLKATSAYNPKINPKNSKRRRDVVLNNLYTHKHITKAECDSLQQLPIDLDFKVENVYDGIAPYFRQAVVNELKEKLPEVDPYSDGLKIYTTLDTRMQKAAEQAVNKQMKIVQRNFKNHWGKREPWVDENGNVIPNFIEKLATSSDTYKKLANRFVDSPDSVDYYMNLPHPVTVFDYDGPKEMVMSSMDSIRYMVKFMHTGFVAMEPQNGEVKAWVGDIDFKSWKYDKVTAMRQPGSTFKLFVYAAAMNQGLTPCDRRRDSYIRMNVYDPVKHETTVWQPSNANGRFSGDSIPLRAAFARSINTIAVKLGQEVGISNVIQVAQSMGIKSPLDDTPSLALGSSDVNLLELVNAYGTVANDGVHVDPVLVTKVVDRDGNTIYEASNESRQAIPYRTAFFMQQMLMAGTHDGGGTSLSLNGYIGQFSRELDYGGKTGTSNNHSDAWFVGVTPNLVGGAWVGGEYRSIHFRTGALGQGSRTALPIFGYFMEAVMKNPQLRQKYGHRFGPAKEDISSDLYNCSYSTPKVETDTAAVDSTSVVDFENLDEGLLQEDGSETPNGTQPTNNNEESVPAQAGKQKEVTSPDEATPPTQEKANKKPKKRKSGGTVEGAGGLI